MKRRIFLILGSSLIACSLLAGCTGDNNQLGSESVNDTSITEVIPEATITPELEGYNLLWSDEFDGDELDLNIWTREVREVGWTNNELQEYRDMKKMLLSKMVILY